MREGGRLSAAIEVLTDFDRRRVPLKMAIADWARNARFAGAKDRAFIAGLCLDALRRRLTLGAAMADPSPRAAVLGAMRFLWKTPMEQLSQIVAEEPHGPGALTASERERLSHEGWQGFFDGASAPEAIEEYVAADIPQWLEPYLARVFGEAAASEGAALAQRADIDLRLNVLKMEPDKALAALSALGAVRAPLLSTAARIAAPASSDRAPAITILPAFNKGWVEVQDLGSQTAAAAAGEIKGAQVLDYCAGGGGKTLALAALMENKGQLYAFDSDARRLQPVYERAARAGVRNLQIRNPAGGDTLDDLAGKMDVVFVDAPCTGSGTWRRHPDTKWRLTPVQLARRLEEQDAVLDQAARFVKPGGRLVYATCSVFKEENEDRLEHFCSSHPHFEQAAVAAQVEASGLLSDQGRDALAACRAEGGALRLTPARSQTDGFFIAVLRRVPD